MCEREQRNKCYWLERCVSEEEEMVLSQKEENTETVNKEKAIVENNILFI